MNVFDFLSPHLPHDWSVKHIFGGQEHDLGQAQSRFILATHPAMKWSFNESGGPHSLRLTLLDQHGHVEVEKDDHAESKPGAKGGIGNMGGASAIIKCTYTEGETAHEYRFEGKLLNLPF